MSWIEGIEESVVDDEPPPVSCPMLRSLNTPINKIHDKLYIGSKEAAENKEILKKYEISHILQVCCCDSLFQDVSFFVYLSVSLFNIKSFL